MAAGAQGGEVGISLVAESFVCKVMNLEEAIAEEDTAGLAAEMGELEGTFTAFFPLRGADVGAVEGGEMFAGEAIFFGLAEEVQEVGNRAAKEMQKAKKEYKEEESDGEEERAGRVIERDGRRVSKQP